MDATHLHLALTHFPIIGSLIGLLLLAAGVFFKKTDVIKAAYFVWILMALISIPVYLTGEPAEETVENLAGVSETIIEQHEEAAELAFILMLVLGGFSLIALATEFMKSKIAGWLRWPAIIFGIVVFGLMARTGNLGGQIRHSEIRKDATTGVTEGENTEADAVKEKKQKKDDDD
jgi:uncharacterized membrane protein